MSLGSTGRELAAHSATQAVIAVLYKAAVYRSKGCRYIPSWNENIYEPFLILTGKPAQEPAPTWQACHSQPSLTSIRHRHHSGSVCRNACGMNIYQYSGTINISESEIN